VPAQNRIFVEKLNITRQSVTPSKQWPAQSHSRYSTFTVAGFFLSLTTQIYFPLTTPFVWVDAPVNSSWHIGTCELITHRCNVKVHKSVTYYVKPSDWQYGTVRDFRQFTVIVRVTHLDVELYSHLCFHCDSHHLCTDKRRPTLCVIWQCWWFAKGLDSFVQWVYVQGLWARGGRVFLGRD